MSVLVDSELELAPAPAPELELGLDPELDAGVEDECSTLSTLLKYPLISGPVVAAVVVGFALLVVGDVETDPAPAPVGVELPDDDGDVVVVVVVKPLERTEVVVRVVVVE